MNPQTEARAAPASKWVKFLERAGAIGVYARLIHCCWIELLGKLIGNLAVKRFGTHGLHHHVHGNLAGAKPRKLKLFRHGCGHCSLGGGQF